MLKLYITITGVIEDKVSIGKKLINEGRSAYM